MDHAKQTDRRAQRRRENVPPEDEAAPGRERSGPVILAALYQQIEALPEKERGVVDLLYFHGLRQAEAAQVLGVAEHSVRRYWVSFPRGWRPWLTTAAPPGCQTASNYSRTPHSTPRGRAVVLNGFPRVCQATSAAVVAATAVRAAGATNVALRGAGPGR